jgi:hypothetical protein
VLTGTAKKNEHKILEIGFFLLLKYSKKADSNLLDNNFVMNFI